MTNRLALDITNFLDQKSWKTPCLLLSNVAILSADVGGLSKRAAKDDNAGFWSYAAKRCHSSLTINRRI